MRSRLVLFALVGLLATTVDIGTLWVLRGLGWSLATADLGALALAAAVAYVLNRRITFRNRPRARWVRSPWLFAGTAVVAGAVDLGVLLGLVALGAGTGPAKVPAIGAAAVVRWTAYRWILFRRVRRDLSRRADRPTPPGDLRLTVVVPAYNEGGFIAGTVEAIAEALSTAIDPDEFEILVVDDGSSDDTVDVARAAGARVVVQPENRGKGAAVRAGMLAARGRTRLFTDADLAYPPALLLRLLAAIEGGWDMVVGSRRHDETDTVVAARRIRGLGGALVNRLTHLVLLGHFRDTQCGIKGFRGDVARTLFERTRIDGFAFDVELFLMAEQDRLSLLEVPVSVENRAGSSVSLVGDGIGLLVDLFRIRLWAGEGVYRPTEEHRRLLDARA